MLVCSIFYEPLIHSFGYFSILGTLSLRIECLKLSFFPFLGSQITICQFHTGKQLPCCEIIRWLRQLLFDADLVSYNYTETISSTVFFSTIFRILYVCVYIYIYDVMSSTDIFTSYFPVWMHFICFLALFLRIGLRLLC